MPHMVTNEENMMNIQHLETRATVGFSGTLTGTKYGNWYGYHKYEEKITA